MKNVFGWESQLRSNYGFQRVGIKFLFFFFLTHFHIQTYASYMQSVHRSVHTQRTLPRVILAQTQKPKDKSYQGCKVSLGSKLINISRELQRILDKGAVCVEVLEWATLLNQRYKIEGDKQPFQSKFDLWHVLFFMGCVSQTGILRCLPICAPTVRFTQSEVTNPSPSVGTHVELYLKLIFHRWFWACHFVLDLVKELSLDFKTFWLKIANN